MSPVTAKAIDQITVPRETLLLGIYEAGIEGCQKQDGRQTSAALVELIGALNFEYEEASMGLFRLYDYCLRQVRDRKFTEVAQILADLRDAWTEALQQNGALVSA
jgi:hypothetical protein